jgi:hypothetical protein
LIASEKPDLKIMRNALLLISVAWFSATCPTASAQIKAQGYDTPSYVQFSAPRYEVSATETNAVVTIVRTGDARKIASVEYSTREGTASDNVNFEPCGGSIVFNPGQTFRTINIPIIPSADAITKTFQVQMAQGDLNTVVTTPSAEIAIQPQPPALDIAAKQGALVVSWPETDSAFILEARLDGQWSSIAETPALANGTWSVAVHPTSPLTFFRLRLNEEAAASPQVAQSAQ